MACLQRDGIGRIVRHQLAQPVDLPVRHLQHAADVAQHGAGLQFAVRDDLRDAVLAVLALHVSDDAVALLLAEIDVEIRHRNALGIEKALEQQSEAQRIEIGDRQRVGDERARTRAASRPDGDAVRLRPLDEVGDDKEVAGKLHLGDDVDLVGETLVVILPRVARRPIPLPRGDVPALPWPGASAPPPRGGNFRFRSGCHRRERSAAGWAFVPQGETRNDSRFRPSSPTPPEDRQIAPPFRLRF